RATNPRCRHPTACQVIYRRARFSAFVRQDASPLALGSPDTRTQTLELYNLVVVEKEVDLRAIIFDVPSEDFWIGRLEHHFLEPECVGDLGRYLGPPGLNVFGNSL